MAARFLSYPLGLSTHFATFASTPVHVEMLRDGERSLPFKRAIEAQVTPGMHVVDIGAGSGLLGLWALAAGAGQLDAIDATAIGSTLEATFAANGFAGKARAHVAHSGKVDLPAKADLVVAEVLGHLGIDEGILETCADAGARLAKPDAKFIPARCDVVAWPVWVPDFENDLSAFWHSKPYGFEMSAMAELSRDMTYACNEHDGQRLADMAVLSSHIIGKPAPKRWQARAKFTAAYKSQHNGFFLSFVADLGGGVMLDGWRTTSWKVVFLPTPKVRTLAKGDVLTLELVTDADGKVRYSTS